MDKMKGFLNIQEFAKISGVKPTTLRYWDEMGLFSPARRSTDNRYRYYALEQIVTANFINALRGLNIPLKTIGEMNSYRTPENVAMLIEQQEELLHIEMRRLREAHSIIQKRLNLIREGICLANDMKDIGQSGENESGIRVMYKDEETYTLGPSNEFKGAESFYGPFARFYRQAEALRINLQYPVGGYYDHFHAFLDKPSCPSRFFSVDPSGNRVRAAGDYMIGFTHGYYGEFGDLPGKMHMFAQKNGLNVFGPVYITYLHDETCVDDPSHYLAQISVAVTR